MNGIHNFLKYFSIISVPLTWAINMGLCESKAPTQKKQMPLNDTL